jgi:hypothetical protein
VLVLTAEKSVLTGLLVVVWGGAASYLSYLAGAGGNPALNGKRIVLAYALGTLVLYLLLNGLCRLLGPENPQ